MFINIYVKPQSFTNLNQSDFFCLNLNTRRTQDANPSPAFCAFPIHPDLPPPTSEQYINVALYSFEKILPVNLIQIAIYICQSNWGKKI